MWKLVSVFTYGVIENPHVMNRARPSSNSEGKPHVEVANSQDILSGIAMATPHVGQAYQLAPQLLYASHL